MQDKNIDLASSIQYIKGVGPTKAMQLNKLNIDKIGDLIDFYPRAYEDRTKLFNIDSFKNGEYHLFKATIYGGVKVQRIRSNLTIITAFVSDDTSNVKMTWFNQNFLKDKLVEGKEFIFYGKAEFSNGRWSVDSAQIYNIDELEKIQGIYPIYNLTAGITQNYIYNIICSVFSKLPLFVEIFSDAFREKHKLCEFNYAVNNIHFPKTFNAIDISRKRLIFEELFLFQLALFTIKRSDIGKQKDTVFENLDTHEFMDLIPFKLTNAQLKVIDEIISDFKSKKITNRLIQGDVGSGKTIVAAVALYLAVKNGYQGALMAPTAILASQHYSEFKKYFDVLGINVDIITSNTTKKNKGLILQKLKTKEIDIIMGTHSLIEDDIEFNNLGLVITDEQHRFGVKQRMKLAKKGKSVETLVMTATPIPRTLAIMLYGDLDLSVIDEMPPGRKPVKTFVVNDSFDTRVQGFIKKEIDAGRQVYVVCPLVDENEELNLTSVEKLYEKYRDEDFKEYSVSYLHGKMKGREKDEIMNRFKNGEINILISTTVIEVGISVSNATIMIVENADRFGLAALHQLRGRVGRGEFQSYCILKSNNKSSISKQRLNIMEKSNNGFEIAQKDLELRGPR